MNYAHVNVEDIETTKSEKLLTVVLAVFVLVGAVWTYQKLDDTLAQALAPTTVELSAADQAALARLQTAEEAQAAAAGRVEQTRLELEFTREAYNTALNEGRPAGERRAAYRRAQEQYAEAQVALTASSESVAEAQPAAEAARIRSSELFRERFDRHELAAFGARLAFVLLLLGGSYVLLGRLRTRHSRYLPLALGTVGAAAVLALVMAGDYVTDYIDPLAFGPLLLSVAGIVLTSLAFLALQRYLARRIPIRRVRKLECPFCGYPVREGEHCAGCGRLVVSPCTTCHEPRRVGTAFCGACGRA